MQDTIDEIIKNSHKQGERIAIANLRHKSRGDAKMVDEQTINRLKNMAKHAVQDTSIPNDQLHNYYCSLCGKINMIANVLIETLPKRRTDGATAIDLKSNFLKLNLIRDKIKHIMRQRGLQTYYRWKCDCGMPIGYTSVTYDQLEEVRMGGGTGGRNFFYVFPDAVVQKMQDSKLISQLITHKETILLHLKRKNKK